MANQSQDICVLTPDYPVSDLTIPALTRSCRMLHFSAQSAIDLLAGQAPSNVISDNNRQHQYEYQIEEIFNSLRDSINGTNTCAHCGRSFANMCILKEHVHKHSCPFFCATKGTITPIAARAELRMHLRHQSFQGLILDQNLMTELAQHCAFCHQPL